MVAFVSLPLERLAALFALAYVGLFVGLIAFTTNGPDPTLQPADEMASAVHRAGGPFGLAVVLWFIGLPIWLIVTSIVLLRRGGRLASSAAR